jgi:hypothetical protein
MMAMVYSGAVCSIAFVFPPEEEHVRSRPDPRVTTPCIIRNATETQCGLAFVPKPVDRYGRTDEHAAYNQPMISERPWSKRAWTFQEHFLSARTIYYGGRNIEWECAEAFCDELRGTMDLNRVLGRELARKARLACPPFSGAFRSPDFLSAWIGFVGDYRSRSLSKSGDRTIAMAGVAEAFQHKHDLTYLAGAWVQALPYCLLWYIPGQHSFDSHPTREPAVMAAPSWSWFAQPLCRKDCHKFEYKVVYGRFPFMARLSTFQWPSLAPNEIPPTVFHDFTGLRISLELATFTTSLQRSRRPCLHGAPDWIQFDSERRYFHCPSLQAGLMSVFDDFGEVDDYEAHGAAGLPVDVQYLCDNREDTTRPPETILLALIIESLESYKSMGKDGKYKFVGRTYRLSGLGLCPAEEEGTWKRHGFWRAYITWPCVLVNGIEKEKRFSRDGWDSYTKQVEDYRLSVIGESDPRSVFLRMGGANMETLTLV